MTIFDEFKCSRNRKSYENSTRFKTREFQLFDALRHSTGSISRCEETSAEYTFLQLNKEKTFSHTSKNLPSIRKLGIPLVISLSSLHSTNSIVPTMKLKDGGMSDLFLLIKFCKRMKIRFFFLSFFKGKIKVFVNQNIHCKML